MLHVYIWFFQLYCVLHQTEILSSVYFVSIFFHSHIVEMLMDLIYDYFILFYLAMPHDLWNLSSPTSDRTRPSAVKAPNPNHWTTRKFLGLCILINF